jgi:cell division protein FtsB
MLDKIKNYPKKELINHLKDVRVLGLVVFGIIVLLVTLSSLEAIQANYVLQKQIARLEQQSSIQELENTNLKLKNEYYNTDQYLELAARRQFGVAAPGEKVFLVPRDVALANSVDAAKAESAPKPTGSSKKPFYQRNFEAWMDFLFYRNRVN